MDQTTIKTLYVFVEIAIDSTHLAQTIRLNFPNDHQRFHETLLNFEETDSQIPTGQIIGKTRHLRIEGPSANDTTTETNETEESASSSSFEPTRLALVSTIQFVAALQRLKEDSYTVEYTAFQPPAGLLQDHSGSSGSSGSDVALTSDPILWSGKYEATIPRSKPLSPGEILGCTAPRLGDVDAFSVRGHNLL